jgi:predicted dithiol-disulfide oxidoreductase (DUF899 family)
MTTPQIVSHEEWLQARKELLVREKEFSKIRDALAEARRSLPWERVSKTYRFTGPDGLESLADLFGKSSQLIAYHFMFDPDWDAGCKSCSFWADNFNGIDIHLRHRNTSFVAISRAPLAKLQAYRKRMGWTFNWVSSNGTSFNYDYDASFTPEQLASGERLYNYGTRTPFGMETPGFSVFFKDGTGAIHHTYSCYSRGVDMLNTAYHLLDLTPKGRDEKQLGANTQAWVRRHDEYGT